MTFWWHATAPRRFHPETNYPIHRKPVTSFFLHVHHFSFSRKITSPFALLFGKAIISVILTFPKALTQLSILDSTLQPILRALFDEKKLLLKISRLFKRILFPVGNQSYYLQNHSDNCCRLSRKALVHESQGFPEFRKLASHVCLTYFRPFCEAAV